MKRYAEVLVFLLVAAAILAGGLFAAQGEGNLRLHKNLQLRPEPGDPACITVENADDGDTGAADAADDGTAWNFVCAENEGPSDRYPGTRGAFYTKQRPGAKGGPVINTVMAWQSDASTAPTISIGAEPERSDRDGRQRRYENSGCTHGSPPTVGA